MVSSNICIQTYVYYIYIYIYTPGDSIRDLFGIGDSICDLLYKGLVKWPPTYHWTYRIKKNTHWITWFTCFPIEFREHLKSDLFWGSPKLMPKILLVISLRDFLRNVMHSLGGLVISYIPRLCQKERVVFGAKKGLQKRQSAFFVFLLGRLDSATPQNKKNINIFFLVIQFVTICNP